MRKTWGRGGEGMKKRPLRSDSKGPSLRTGLACSARREGNGLQIYLFIFFSDASDTLNKMAVFLCTHFIDQRIINPGEFLPDTFAFQPKILFQ